MVDLIMKSLGVCEIDAIQELAYMRQLYNTGEFDAEELLERVGLTEKYVEQFLKEIK